MPIAEGTQPTTASASPHDAVEEGLLSTGAFTANAASGAYACSSGTYGTFAASGASFASAGAYGTFAPPVPFGSRPAPSVPATQAPPQAYAANQTRAASCTAGGVSAESVGGVSGASHRDPPPSFVGAATAVPVAHGVAAVPDGGWGDGSNADGTRSTKRSTVVVVLA